ncbi:MAG: substrate-binding domain-containing protein [Bauldia sp.]|nr:substrate-binding domain-containing protein [Bauldia sp.]
MTAAHQARAEDDGTSADLAKDAETVVDTAAYKKDPPYTIAALTQGPINGWGLTLDSTFRYLADQEPDVADLILPPINADVDRQISAMENMINVKPDIILLEPLSAAALAAPVARAMAAGIPVVVCADGVEGKPYVSYADVDLYRVGYQTAEALVKDLDGKGKVVMINGIPGVDAAEAWKKAGEDVFAKYPDIEVVASEYANWSIPTSKEKATAMLAANPEIDGVYAGGSEGAIGALLAFAEAGRDQPKYGAVVPLNGWLRLAMEHKVEFTSWPQPAALEAKYCFETGMKVLRGEEVTKFVPIPEDVVTEANAAEFYIPELKDDFSGPAVAPVEYYIDAGFSRE